MRPDEKPGAGELDLRLAAHPRLAQLDIPPVLRGSVERHQANLVRLLQSFRAAGMDEARIEAAVTVIIESYKRELLDAIRMMSADNDGASVGAEDGRA